MGLYNHHANMSSSPTIVPTSDMCGDIVTVGANVTRFTAGTRVLSIFNQTHLTGQVTPENMKSGLGLPLPGTLTEYRVFPEDGLVLAPESLTDEEACTLPIAGVTAWMALNWHRPMGSCVSAGETVLIQGTGGVAIMGLLFAKAAGATVIITSSSNDKLSKAKALGADYGINYRTTPDWEKEVLKVTDGKGADIIFENGGAQTLRKSFDCVAFGGLIDCIGYLSGKETDKSGGNEHTNLLALRRNVTLKGLLNGPRERFEELCKFVEEKTVKPVVDKVFGFAEAKESFKYLYGGGHFGKVVIKVE